MTEDIRARRLAISTLIERAGGVKTLSEAMGISTQAIYNWRMRGWVPADKALLCEELYEVPRETLVRPALAAFLVTPYKPAEDVL